MRGPFAGSAEREAETLRQMSDLFSEVGRLSVDLGAVFQAVEQLRAEIRDSRADLASLHAEAAVLSEAVTNQIEAANQSVEALGRLLQSARSRIDALEEAARPGTRGP